MHRLRIINDSKNSFFIKVHKFITDFNIFKKDKEFNWNIITFFFKIYIFNKYDVLRIKKEGAMLATILIKKIWAEENIIIKIFQTSNNVNLKDENLLQNIKEHLLTYSILGYKKIIIELKQYEITKKKFFEKLLDFEEDTAEQLSYLISNYNKNTVILFKKLK